MKTEYRGKKALVILGAGIMQIPAIRSALKKGFVTVVFDGNANAAGRGLPHYFENIDLRDIEAMLEKCLEYREFLDIRGVFTAGTDFSYAVAWLSEKMGLESLSYETALRATVKSEMRSVFAEKSVPSPAFIIADSCGFDMADIAGLGFPLVVKPVDSMGARGTVRIEKSGDLENAVKNALKYSRRGKAIVEQFVDGQEFSLDALVWKGEVYICGIADRHIFFPPYFIEMGHTMPSDCSEDILREVSDVFIKGIKALGIDNGAAKGDIKYSGKGAVVGEIAARLSGGYMSGWTFPYSTGFSVTDAAVDIAAGTDPGNISYSYQNTSVERAFISVPGIVASVFLPEYLKEKSGNGIIRDLFINVRPGDRVDFPRNNVEKCGNVIAVHRERAKAVEWAEKACRDIVVRLEPCNDLTHSFIFGEKESWIPDAFSSCIPDCNSMDDFYNIENAVSADPARICVLLPERNMPGCGSDWQGRSMGYALEQIFEMTGVEYVDNVNKGGIFTLGSVFWKSVFRAGVQGGIWIADTVADYIKRGMDIKSIKW